MSKNIITDTGFWIAYFNERDAYHKDAVELSSLVFENVKIDYIATFNRKDFLTNCMKRNIDFLP
jgi:hypothetical protein